jgi:hypothetical protein
LHPTMASVLHGATIMSGAVILVGGLFHKRYAAGALPYRERRPNVTGARFLEIQSGRVGPCRPVIQTPGLLRGGSQRLMCAEEDAHAVNCPLLQLLWLLPWEHRDLGVRRQRGDIDRGLQRMPRYVIR